jgi:hypothetical protein
MKSLDLQYVEEFLSGKRKTLPKLCYEVELDDKEEESQ